MLDWTVLAFERWCRTNVHRTSRLARLTRPWFIRHVSRAKLVHALRHVWLNCPAQRERWRNAGLRLGDLRSPEVLPRIPFTEPVELAEHPETFCCVPTDQLTHVFTTTGTKGTPKKVYVTEDDFERQVKLIGTFLHEFRAVGGGGRALAMFNIDLPTWSAGTVARRGIEEAGLFGLLSPTSHTARQQIALIREYHINILLSMPAYVHRLTLEAADDGVDLTTLGVRIIQVGGQAWSERFRRDIEQAWAAKLIDSYGSMECVCGTASECVEQDGLHVAELEFWVEIVDPDTGEVLPDGTEGEVVLTTLSRRGMPLVRYRTRDLARLLPRGKRCACGLPTRKMSRVRGRLDDTIIIGGDANVFADEWDRAFLSIPGVSDYELTVTKNGYKDVLNLRVEGDVDNPALAERVAEAFYTIPHVKIPLTQTLTAAVGDIEIVPRGALSAGRPKSRRIVDERETPTFVTLERKETS